MMSCQALRDVRLYQAAGPRRVRPRVEAEPGPVRPLRDPDLLERRPAVRRPLRPQQLSAVAAHEAPVHLGAAVLRRAPVPPAALVAVDAEPGTEVRWAVGRALRRPRPPLPEPDRAPDVGYAHRRQVPSRRGRAGPSHQLLPVPGRALVVPDLRAEP